MKFSTITISANLGGNTIKEVMIIEATDRHEAKEQAEAELIKMGRAIIWKVLPIRDDAIHERIKKEKAKAKAKA
jgi:hypothetical protein